MIVRWDDLKQQAVKNAARFRDIPNLHERAARVASEFCHQSEPKDDNELLTRQLALISMDSEWMNEAEAFLTALIGTKAWDTMAKRLLRIDE